MSENTAYKTTDAAVLASWDDYMAASEDVRQRRAELAERFGRNVMVNRSSFGHGTRIVGFERIDSDEDGDTPHDGLLRVKKHDRTVTPNIRRKAGKELAEELATLSSPVLDLPGMPSWHLSDTDRGMATFAPALWRHEGAIYALWGTGDAPVKGNWDAIPLSAYYAAKEQYTPTTKETTP